MSGRRNPSSDTPWTVEKNLGSQNRKNHQIGSVRNFPNRNVQVWRCARRLDHAIFADVSGGSLRIYASSRGESFGSSCGRRERASQQTIQTALKAPVTRDANSQPRRSRIQGTTREATVTPALVPEIN